MLSRWALYPIFLLGLTGCVPQPGDAPIGEEIPAPENLKVIAAGEVVYVPAYARIHHLKLKDRTAALVTTLAIHNTDMKNPIVLRQVNYYAENGSLLRTYTRRPRLLPPLATAIYYLAPEEGAKAGIGANAIVEWVAESPVAKPLVESIMVSTDHTLGISFMSQGYKIRTIAGN
ncbi:MAG: hypothetical protein OHK0011_20500 [Turneriella sp.]